MDMDRTTEHPQTDVEIDAPLTCRRSEKLDDWYVIERRDIREASPIRTSAARRNARRNFWEGARISDADIEGNSVEMFSVAEAIREGRSYAAKRCAVEMRGDSVALWSPCNSSITAIVPRRVAVSLALAILATIAPTFLQQWGTDE